jgi:hypothetical protein
MSTKEARRVARALLRRVTLTGLRAHETHSGVAWTAKLCLDGTPVLVVEQAGRGEGNTYYPAGDYATAYALQWKLAEACVAVGLGPLEPLDALTSAMEPGMTGADAVRIAKRYG